ncbi:MAG TPA: GNAT family N-acetyltransferase [Drouetiella sp.]|jgi:GNAT superfamily N-acetyltransferase
MSEPTSTKGQYLIRKATPEDAQVLLDLIVAHAEYEREDFPTEGKLEAIKIALSATPQPFESILIESDGEVRGYCNYLVQYDTWALAPHMLLDALFLKPEMRGQGIGMEIMNFIRAQARQAGCKTVRWQTPVFNEMGINFYKKLNTVSGTKMFFTWDV